jgi:hypothetical protein
VHEPLVVDLLHRDRVAQVVGGGVALLVVGGLGLGHLDRRPEEALEGRPQDVHVAQERNELVGPGSVLFRRAAFRHNVRTDGPNWSVIVTSHRVRPWGFITEADGHCR